MRRLLMVLTVSLVAAPVAVAQETLPDTEGGRFILRRVDDGLMRVDRETGATSFCRKRGEAWTCEFVADDRVALEDEIERLTEDNAELAIEVGRLQERIAQLEARLDEGGKKKSKPKTDLPESERTLPEFDFPSDEELDQVMKGFDSMMRRFLDMMRDLREEYDQDRT